VPARAGRRDTPDDRAVRRDCGARHHRRGRSSAAAPGDPASRAARAGDPRGAGRARASGADPELTRLRRAARRRRARCHGARAAASRRHARG
jgi:hypothetical protein